jgi:hypothetical protein
MVRNELVDSIITYMESKGMEVFKGYGRGYNFNLVQLRNRSAVNTFNDPMVLFWNSGSKWETFIIKDWTTDAGITYMVNPINRAGCANLVEGQSKIRLGKHFGREALVQAGQVYHYRDNDLNTSYNWSEDSITLDNGWSGFNIHWMYNNSKVDNASAGCQGTPNKTEWLEFMGLIKKGMALYGNTMTRTILELKDMDTKILNLL